jgi:hypothetical protein
MLDLLLRKDVEVVSVPHVENEETVEGQLYFFEIFINVGLFEIQKGSENAERNIPAKPMLIVIPNGLAFNIVSSAEVFKSTPIFR